MKPTETRELHRLPLRFLLLAWLDNIPAALGLVIGLVIVGQHDTTPDWVRMALWMLMLLRLCGPAVTWATLRYSVDGQGVSVRKGLVTRRERRMAWPTMASVLVERPWAYRAGGLSRVVITQAGSESTRLELPGVDVFLAQHVLAHQGDVQPNTGESGTVVYRSSPKELLLISVLYGQIAILGAAATMAVVQALQTAGVAGTASQIVARSPLVLGATFGLLALLAGAVGTAVKYWDFTVTTSEDSVRLTYGLLSRRDRHISRDKIVGVELRRNLLEAALGRVRLSVKSTDSASGLGTNLLLPSLREDLVATIARNSFPEVIGTRSASSERRVGLLGLSIATTTLAGALPLLVVESPLLRLVCLSAVVWLTVRAGRILTTRITHRGEAARMSVRSTWLTDKLLILPIDSLRSMHSVSAMGLVTLVTLTFYAGGPQTVKTLNPTIPPIGGWRYLSRTVPHVEEVS